MNLNLNLYLVVLYSNLVDPSLIFSYLLYKYNTIKKGSCNFEYFQYVRQFEFELSIFSVNNRVIQYYRHVIVFRVLEKKISEKKMNKFCQPVMFKNTINYTYNFCILDFHTTKFKAFSQYYSTVNRVISYHFFTLRIVRILPIVCQLFLV